MSLHQPRNAYGPSAFGSDSRRFLELVLTLARSEFKLRYFGSVLGYVWSLLRPLLFFGVLYFVFTKLFHAGRGVPHYGVYLLSTIVLWTYMGEATAGSVKALVDREALLRKIRFPRLVIPLSVSLTATFNLALNILVIVVFALVNGVAPRWQWLEAIPIVALLIIFSTGIAMILSAAYVRARDVQPIWDVFLNAWFYCTPIMYLAAKYRTEFGPTIERLGIANPPGMLFTQLGNAIIGGRSFPNARDAGGGVPVLISFILIFGIFAFGLWFFAREAPRIAENL